MNYLLVLGRGIEGAGNTRNAIDYSLWLNSNGHSAKVLAYCDKSWVRSNLHEGSKSFIKLKLSADMDQIFKEIDWADRILVLSVPAVKSEDLVKENFMKTVEYANSKGVFQAYFQLDHNLQSIYRNFYTNEKYYKFFSLFDIVFTHSLNNDFCAKFIKKNKIEINKIVARSETLHNVFGIDFDLMREKYWQPYEAKEKKSLRFIGRAAIWKGPWVLKDIHTKYLRADGYITYLEGIECAVHSIKYILKSKKPRVIDENNILTFTHKLKNNPIDNGTYEFKRNMPVYLLPPYDNNQCMKRLAKTEYGIELLLLKDYFLENVIENAMLEIVAVGAIPVFRKHWAEKFKVGGKTIAEWGENETGTILMDENDPEPAIKKMNAIAADKVRYDEMRENAFAFYKRFFDINVIIKLLIGKIDDYVNDGANTH